MIFEVTYGSVSQLDFMEIYVLNFGEDYILTILTIFNINLVKVKINKQLLYYPGKHR